MSLTRVPPSGVVTTTNFVFQSVAVSLPTTGLLNQGAFSYGTLSYTDNNNLLTLQASTSSYAQMVIQNSNAGASASADITISNNLGTANSYYANFGINSSNYSGVGSFNLPNAVYFASQSGDMVLGSYSNNSIRFTLNGNATDTVTISTVSNSVIINSSATITNTNASINTTTGALQVAGGVGVGGGMVVGGVITATTFVGAFTGNITGTASTATNAGTAYATIGTHTAGTGITGSTFNGSSNQTWSLNTSTLIAIAVTATSAATAYSSIGTLTAGTGITGSAFNGSANQTFSLNTSTLMQTAVTALSASGSAGSVANALTIGTGLSGTAGTYNGSAAVTVSLNTATYMTSAVLATSSSKVANAHSAGTGLTGTAFDGSSAQTWTLNTSTLIAIAVTATSAATAYSSIGTLTAGTGITGSAFNGSANQTFSLNTSTLMQTAVTALSASGSAGSVANALTIGTGLSGTAGTYNGSAAVTVSLNTATYMTSAVLATSSSKVANAHSAGTGLTGTAFDGSSAQTWSLNTSTLMQTAVTAFSASGSAGSTVAAVTFNNGGSGAASGTTFNGGTAQTVSYNTVGAPSTTGVNASGSWGIYTNGIRQSDGTSWLNAASAIGSSGSRGVNLAPNTYSQGIFSEFKDASLYGTSGTYAGLITYANWVGTTASTGDPSYQLLFSPSAANATSNPSLKFRAGIDTTWGAWNTIVHSGNIGSYAVASSGGTVTGNVTLNGATPQISLTNGTSNYISYAGNGVNAPTFTTSSPGTKLLLYPAVSSTSADYAIGIAGSTLWNGVPTTGSQFQWYGGTTVAATLTGAGALTLASTVSTSAGLSFGYLIATGFYGDNTNVAIRTYGSTGSIYFQSASGAGTYAIMNSGGLSITGAITATGDITAFYSDRRLKENVKPIDNAVSKVQKLTGITYNPNELAESFGFERDQDIVGLFADEVESVLPQAVKPAPFDQTAEGESKSGENYLTVQYEKVVPLLVEAIKEQQAMIEELRAEIQQLKATK